MTGIGAWLGLAVEARPVLAQSAMAQTAPSETAPPQAPPATAPPALELARAAPAAAPSAASVAALLFDVSRIVAAETDSGWLIDETALDEIHGDVMASVCRTTPEVRQAALTSLERVAAELGDARSLYASQGELTPEVKAALRASRQRDAMRRAVLEAPRQCPFWVRAQPEFRGLQSTRDRMILNFDTGGTVQLRQTQGTWTIGAGGFGRLLGGYSFTRVSLLAGFELGGGALLEPNTQPTEFVVNYLPALPVIVRTHYQDWNLDLEGAPVALFQAGNTRWSYGVRAGATIGFSSLRVRGILPWVGLGIATEYHFENSARPEAWYLRGGFRVGGVWDP
jgi:hypothetical protein